MRANRSANAVFGFRLRVVQFEFDAHRNCPSLTCPGDHWLVGLTSGISRAALDRLRHWLHAMLGFGAAPDISSQQHRHHPKEQSCVDQVRHSA
jgi:hypothetical protein